MQTLPLLPRLSLPSLLALGFASTYFASAHPDHDLSGELAPDTVLLFAASRGGGSAALPEGNVAITTNGAYRVIVSNGLPDHEPGQFPRRGNPNPIAAQSCQFRTALKPVAADKTTPTAPSSFGVALNGVPFEPGTAEFWNNDRRSGWNFEAMSGFINLGLDEHNAHVQPTGAYHYHGMPVGLADLKNDTGKDMVQIGWAADGFPIYTSWGHADPMNAKSPMKKMRSSYRLKAGSRTGGPGGKYDGKFTEDYEYAKGSGDLDECNGRFGVTPEFPEGIYHYYITAEFPVLSRFWKGTPDRSFMKGPGGPGRGRGPGFGPPQKGRPPQKAKGAEAKALRPRDEGLISGGTAG